MKKYIILMNLFLSGCYLANGSPNSDKFWIKDNDVNRKKEWKYCTEKAYSRLTKQQQIYINQGEDNWDDLYRDKEKYKLYENAIKLDSMYFSECIYKLGYRFNAPLYWCLAQDGDNTKICIDNMKYRN